MAGESPLRTRFEQQKPNCHDHQCIQKGSALCNFLHKLSEILSCLRFSLQHLICFVTNSYPVHILSKGFPWRNRLLLPLLVLLLCYALASVTLSFSWRIIRRTESHLRMLLDYNMDRIPRALEVVKNPCFFFFQSTKHRKGVFYCFSPRYFYIIKRMKPAANLVFSNFPSCS